MLLAAAAIPTGVKAVSFTVLALVSVVDQEDFGQHNYLFSYRNHYAQYEMAYSSMDKLGDFKEGEKLTIRVEMECTEGRGVDESFKTFWATYRVLTCDISKIEILP